MFLKTLIVTFDLVETVFSIRTLFSNTKKLDDWKFYCILERKVRHLLMKNDIWQVFTTTRCRLFQQSV